MPNIREFTANAAVSAQERGLNLLQPTERGSGAMANLARTQGALGERTGRSIAEGISSVGTASVSVVNNYLTQRDEMRFNQVQPDYWSAGVLGWKKFAGSTDITDAQAVEQFNENLTKQDQEFMDSFTTERGKQLAMNEIRRRRDHMSQVQISDVSTRTGELAVNSVLENVNKSGAIVQRDPHFLDIALQNTDDMVARLKANPNITEEQRAGFDRMGELSKRNIAKTAFLTMAQANPAAAKADLEAGWQDKLLKPEDRDELLKLSDAYIKQQKSAGRQQEAQARRVEQEKTNAAFADTYTKHFNPGDGTWNDLPGLARDIMQIGTDFPTTAAPTVKAGLEMVERLTKEANGEPLPVADPSTAEDFRQRMLLPPDDPKRLTDEQVFAARANGRLSNQEFAFYKDAVTTMAKDPAKRDAYAQFNKFLNGMKSSITKSNMLTGQVFPEQDRRYYQFSVDMRSQFEAAYKTGNWQDMLNPSSSNYLGKQVSPYQLSNKQSLKVLKDNVNLNAPPSGAGPAVPNDRARKPSESPADYLKRMNGG